MLALHTCPPPPLTHSHSHSVHLIPSRWPSCTAPKTARGSVTIPLSTSVIYVFVPPAPHHLGFSGESSSWAVNESRAVSRALPRNRPTRASREVRRLGLSLPSAAALGPRLCQPPQKTRRDAGGLQEAASNPSSPTGCCPPPSAPAFRAHCDLSHTLSRVISPDHPPSLRNTMQLCVHTVCGPNRPLGLCSCRSLSRKCSPYPRGSVSSPLPTPTPALRGSTQTRIRPTVCLQPPPCTHPGTASKPCTPQPDRGGHPSACSRTPITSPAVQLLGLGHSPVPLTTPCSGRAGPCPVHCGVPW